MAHSGHLSRPPLGRDAATAVETDEEATADVPDGPAEEEALLGEKEAACSLLAIGANDLAGVRMEPDLPSLTHLALPLSTTCVKAIG